MPGATAYFGFLEICQPRVGETVVVTGAAGAVGSLEELIAKIIGCRVIGFAVSDDKMEWLETELGFDKALNYKSVDAAAALKQATLKGLDCYFNNVGGELSIVIISQMHEYERIAVCGAINSYNEHLKLLLKATILQPFVVFKQLKIRGLVVTRWSTRWLEAFSHLVELIKSGQLKAKEQNITEGFGNVFDAFIGMLTCKNNGKAVSKIP